MDFLYGQDILDNESIKIMHEASNIEMEFSKARIIYESEIKTIELYSSIDGMIVESTTVNLYKKATEVFKEATDGLWEKFKKFISNIINAIFGKKQNISADQQEKEVETKTDTNQFLVMTDKVIEAVYSVATDKRVQKVLTIGGVAMTVKKLKDFFTDKKENGIFGKSRKRKVKDLLKEREAVEKRMKKAEDAAAKAANSANEENGNIIRQALTTIVNTGKQVVTNIDDSIRSISGNEITDLKAEYDKLQAEYDKIKNSPKPDEAAMKKIKNLQGEIQIEMDKLGARGSATKTIQKEVKKEDKQSKKNDTPIDIDEDTDKFVSNLKLSDSQKKGLKNVIRDANKIRQKGEDNLDNAIFASMGMASDEDIKNVKRHIDKLVNKSKEDFANEKDGPKTESSLDLLSSLDEIISETTSNDDRSILSLVELANTL